VRSKDVAIWSVAIAKKIESDDKNLNDILNELPKGGKPAT
jgi:hypothetical protein